jgi:hypothetical protein
VTPTYSSVRDRAAKLNSEPIGSELSWIPAFAGMSGTLGA